MFAPCKLGFSKSSCSLQSFAEAGGAKFCARTLVGFCISETDNSLDSQNQKLV